MHIIYHWKLFITMPFLKSRKDSNHATWQKEWTTKISLEIWLGLFFGLMP